MIGRTACAAEPTMCKELDAMPFDKFADIDSTLRRMLYVPDRDKLRAS